MKWFGCTTVLFLLLLATKGLASDFLHGEVIHLDRQAMSMTVRTGPEAEDGVIRTVVLSEELLVETKSGTRRLPGCLKSGSRVRVWGAAPGSGEEEPFYAEKVRGCEMGGCNDPTGVRERLHRSRRGDTARPCL